jgi:hypothetical protein
MPNAECRMPKRLERAGGYSFSTSAELFGIRPSASGVECGLVHIGSLTIR